MLLHDPQPVQQHKGRRTAAESRKPAATVTATQTPTKEIPSSGGKHEPKKPQQCSYCRTRTGHNVRNCAEENSALVSQPTGSQSLTLSSAYSLVSPVAWSIFTSPISKVARKSDVDLVSEKQATPTSLPKSAFWPLINISETVAGANCGFRAMAHTLQSQESMWPEVSQRLLDHLNGNPAGYLHDVAITTGTKVSWQRV